MQAIRHLLAAVAASLAVAAAAQTTEQVVDLPTRAGVTQRLLVITPPEPKAAVILLAGGHGGLQIFPNGSMRWGEGNFLVRSRRLFADEGLAVVVMDAPSDRQSPPYLRGFRQTPEHVADLKAVIAWTRRSGGLPVWLVGTSRGTESAAYAATELVAPDAPDGVVLTSSILSDAGGRPVPAMPLAKVRVPVLVVHHEHDGCGLCPFSEVPALMAGLTNAPRSAVLSFTGGANRGAACEAFAHHGFNGLEPQVVRQAAAWLLAR